MSNTHHVLTAQPISTVKTSHFKQDSWAYYSILTFNFNTQTNCYGNTPDNRANMEYLGKVIL